MTESRGYMHMVGSAIPYVRTVSGRTSAYPVSALSKNMLMYLSVEFSNLTPIASMKILKRPSDLLTETYSVEDFRDSGID